jgi:hypothetical protein
MAAVDVYLEVGHKRVFASALDWPGWSRSGRDEVSALQALVDYGPRYAAVVGAISDFTAPAGATDLRITERVPGNASTDYGVPAAPASIDSRPLGEAELARLVDLLEACWAGFDGAAASASTLRAGPRGGGRDVRKMRSHVLDAESAYVGGLGGRFKSSGGGAAADLESVRVAFREAVTARARGETPDRGPRGGLRWSARYAIRRSAWHSLDHAWEIEDRSA